MGMGSTLRRIKSDLYGIKDHARGGIDERLSPLDRLSSVVRAKAAAIVGFVKCLLDL
jgi:hypothetical protein